MEWAVDHTSPTGGAENAGQDNDGQEKHLSRNQNVKWPVGAKSVSEQSFMQLLCTQWQRKVNALFATTTTLRLKKVHIFIFWNTLVKNEPI